MQAASLSSERSSDGSQTYIRIDGVVNEQFDGKQAAARIKSKSVVINCSGMAMITSYGVRAWLEFVRSLERRKLDLYFVECSTAFVRELNQVIEFAGPGQIVSCYLPYSCPQCSAQRTVLFRLDLDKKVVKGRDPDEYSCLVCGTSMDFDDEPGLFFPALEPHVGAEIATKVLEFLKARLNYESSSNTRLTVLKDVTKDATVLSFAGTLDGSLNGPQLAQGLQGEVALDLNNIIHVQQQGLRAWREFLNGTSPHAARLWLIGCPTLIVEKGLEVHDGMHLVSVRIPYYCHSCEQTDFVLVELASRDGRALAQGQLRERPCSSCKQPTRPMVSTNVIAMLGQLAAESPPRHVQKAAAGAAKRLAKARAAHAARHIESQRIPRWVPILAMVAVVGAGLAVAAGATVLWRTRTVATTAPTVTHTPGTQGPAVVRPDWIISDTPSTSYCVDLGWQLRCVGVSSYHPNLDEAEKEGFEAALEVFVHTALLNSRSEALEIQRSAYLKMRTLATGDLERATQSNDLKAAKYARQVIAKARARVANAIKLVGAPGAPTQRSDHYWEEYEAKDGSSEFLAFVRIDIGNNEVLAFSKHYSTKLRGSGASMTRLNPSLAWVLPKDVVAVGLFVESVSDKSPIAEAGIQARDAVITSPEVVSDSKPVAALLKMLEGKQPVEVRRGSSFDERLKPKP